MHDHQLTQHVPNSGRPTRHDNKVRLSQDVLEKAELIAAEWGLKNARAAVEAVFRRYCDDYLYGRPSEGGDSFAARETALPNYGEAKSVQAKRSLPAPPKCEALDALDQLLAL
ncbi:MULTISPECIES: hypothetical protein [Cyanophyceae]|uniref:hypothetical protein n=1 Tax=Cyanophyceae TaxID=3028117 RepID=UPI001689892E|nr:MULTISPECIES: hypothetical protein [Cyanophyceae]MBD1915441.1 hypothetical protein [Phormidium sp. FACHB-77]MBD2028512.1 hypothetical protein [Phormidium sp. FACHB-322]MBD2051052.1 hypothetical protein [Leptolyngbya sp. FACHB-60]